MLPSRTLTSLALTIGLTAAGCAPASKGGAAGAKEPAQGAAAAPDQGAAAPAAGGDAQQPAVSADAQPKQAVVGGFSAQDPTTPQIQAIAGRAVELLKAREGDPSIALVKVVSAETQVVAGLNYRLKLDVTTKAGPKTVTVVLYRDFKGNHELSSVEGL